MSTNIVNVRTVAQFFGRCTSKTCIQK